VRSVDTAWRVGRERRLAPAAVADPAAMDADADAPPAAVPSAPAVANGAVPAGPAAPAPNAPTDPDGPDAAPAVRPSLVITVKPATPVPEPPPTPTVRVTAPALPTGPVQPPVLIAQSVHVDVGDRTRPRATAVTALHVRLAAATEPPPAAHGAAEGAPPEPLAGWTTVLTLACCPRCTIERVTVAALPAPGAPPTDASNAPVTATFYHR